MGDKSSLKSRPGFDDIANKEGFDDQYGYIPVQPGDMSRVWGASSFVAPPTFGGALQPGVAQQCGYLMPSSPYHGKGTNSGVLLAAADPDATA